MVNSLAIEDQKNEVKQYLTDQFDLHIRDLNNFNEFLNNSIKGIIAIKIWKDKLRIDMDTDSAIYIDEIVSNLNQVLIMGTIGFKIPSAILIRRSYENLDSFLYYKDHPVEFFLKEAEQPRRSFKGEELKEYLEKYPFIINDYPRFNSEKAKRLNLSLIKHKSEQYSKLSNYVHATNHRYLQLSSYIEDIKPHDDTLDLINRFILEFNTISNCFFIMFFNNKYQELQEIQKSAIRSSIGGGNRRYKKQLQEIFGEL